MVGVCLDDRIEINTAHAEALEIVELFGDALEVAHKEVGVGDLTVLVGLPYRKRVPVLVAGKILALELLLLAAEIKTVGKDLIHYAADRPLRSLKALFVAGELPASAGRILDSADFVRVGRL